MRPDQSPSPIRKILTPRRLVLLASVAAVAGTMLAAGPGGYLNFAQSPLIAPAQAAGEVHGPVGFADVVQKVKPAVISVKVKLQKEGPELSSNEDGDAMPVPKGSPFERFFREFGMPNGQGGQGGQGGRGQQRQFGQAQGSGFFISADGYAVTNNHVVDHASSVEVATDDGKTYTAKVVGTDAKTDVALIKVDGRSDFPYVKFSNTDPRVGDWVIAVGNPFGLGGTVTAGIVSARGRDIGAGPYDDFIQVDAPVNKGNSGGPAFDEDGNVVGVTTAIYSPSGGSVGIGFAIPANTVKTVVAQLKDGGSVTRGWIGVQIQTVTQEIADSLGLKSTDGALVAEPQADGPAAKAGIQSGDLIQSVDGQDVKDSRDLAKKIAAVAPGTSVRLGMLHKGSAKTVSLTVAKMPNESLAKNDSGAPKKDAPLGLTLAPAASVAGEGEHGVAVTGVDPNGPGAEHGMRAGDVILEVAGKAVSTPAEVRGALDEARSAGKRSVLMRVKSENATHFVALPIAAG
jgi:serine protease Do